MKNARPPKNEKTSAPSKRKSSKPRHFLGTENPRHLRVIMALMVRPRSREDIDRTAGASNGPDLIGELRCRGLDAECRKTPCIDRDGFEVQRGIYYFTDRDRRLIRAWLKRRDRQHRKASK
jgi:hypothetical protein